MTEKLRLSSADESEKMYSRRKRRSIGVSDLLVRYSTKIHSACFLRDMGRCTREVIVESPFITTRRMTELMPVFRKLRKRGVRVLINTRDPEEHDAPYDDQARRVVIDLQALGAVVFVYWRASSEAGDFG